MSIYKSCSRFLFLFFFFLEWYKKLLLQTREGKYHHTQSKIRSIPIKSYAFKNGIVSLQLCITFIQLERQIMSKKRNQQVYTWSEIKHQGIVQLSQEGAHANQPTKDIRTGWQPCNQQLTTLLEAEVINEAIIVLTLNTTNACSIRLKVRL